MDAVDLELQLVVLEFDAAPVLLLAFEGGQRPVALGRVDGLEVAHVNRPHVLLQRRHIALRTPRA